MDNNDEDRKRWLAVHRNLEFARRLREKRKRIAIRKKIRPSRRLALPYLVLSAPMEMDFESHYEQTTTYLERIRRTSSAGGHTMLIWMRNCVALAPDVALVLAAEIARCLHHRPHSLNGNNPQSSAVAAMLRDIGFHKMLNFREPEKSEAAPDNKTTYVKMKSGVQGAGQHADDLRELVLGDAAKTSDQLRDDIVRGLNEAVLNVQQHAYEDGLEIAYVPMPNKRWWIAGYRDSATKEIGFIAFDQGAGIPATLPRTHGEFVKDILAAVSQVLSGDTLTSDHLLIKRAFELGRSRTGKTGQGRGLADFKRFLGVAGGKGSLRILSGRGRYIYHLDGTEIVEPLPMPFHGTLIVWRLTDSPAVWWEDGVS